MVVITLSGPGALAGSVSYGQSASFPSEGNPFCPGPSQGIQDLPPLFTFKSSLSSIRPPEAPGQNWQVTGQRLRESGQCGALHCPAKHNVTFSSTEPC